MGVKEDFDISNQEAANIIRNFIQGTRFSFARGSGKSYTQLRYMQALAKAVDVLENTPNKLISKPKLKTGGYVKLCPDCDGKDFHPCVVLMGESSIKYKHFCPKCGKIWNECDDE